MATKKKTHTVVAGATGKGKGTFGQRMAKGLSSAGSTSTRSSSTGFSSTDSSGAGSSSSVTEGEGQAEFLWRLGKEAPGSIVIHPRGAKKRAAKKKGK